MNSVSSLFGLFRSRPPIVLLTVCLALLLAVGSLSTAQAQSSDPEKSYRLGPGDRIQIMVHGEPELSVEMRLEGDGYISYPFLGNIRVTGVTTEELRQRIHSGLKGDYLVSPEVNVYVLEYRPIYVNGEVKKPGGYPYVPGMTVQKAIALAGGMTDLASKRKMYVIREGDRRSQREDVSMNMRLGPGDALIIEEGFF